MLNKYTKHLIFSLILMLCFGNLQAQDTERVRVYRVQFAASKTFIQPSYFQKKFNLEDSIKYFEKDDYYKYYVGDFNTEAEATTYFHKTGDVGYITSIMIDRPIVVEQDTIKAQIVPDTVAIDTEDTVKVDTTSLPEVSKPIEESKEQDNKGLTRLQRTLISFGFFILVLLILWAIMRRMKRIAAKKNSEPDTQEDKQEERQGDEEEEVAVDGEVEESGEDEEVIILAEDNDDDLLPWDDQVEELENPFTVLDDSASDLSGWDQLRMLEKLKKGEAQTPDFSSWLNSDNSTILAFCLRMIRSQKQENAFNAVSRLLNHKKDDIRAEAIVTLGVLGSTDALKLFRDKFDQETFTNKMLILRSMARLPDESNIEFLKDLIKVQGNLQVEAAYALSSIESVGIEGVEEILNGLGISSETIARHILINKL